MAAEAARSAPAQACYHCGLPVPAGADWRAEIGGAPRAFCCAGCRAVAQAIHAAGLDGYYRRRPAAAGAPPPPRRPDLETYDLDEVQAAFTDIRQPRRSIHLLVEGIHCSACMWLIEHALAAVPGVEEAEVNLAQKRLHLTWDNRRVRLSALLGRLAGLGYAAVPYDPEIAEGAVRREARRLLYRVGFAGFAAMNMMWVAIALYAGAAEGEFRDLFHWVGLALATPTVFYAGWPFLRGAWASLRGRRPTMDVPIALGALATWGYSAAITLSGTRAAEPYFDSVVGFVFVLLVGRFLESLARRDAVAAGRRLLELQPQAARRLEADGSERMTPVRALRPGDLVRVRPGERIPVDGLVVEGEGSAEESLLTGESRPVPKRPGARVRAGTLSLDAALTVRTEAVLADTALGRIVRLVEAAQASRAPIQRLADRVVPWFVAATLALAAATFLAWLDAGAGPALVTATAVLIVTCPCAFGLATPMAVAVAAGRGARRGILVRDGAALEALARCDTVVLDKTGTVTEGRPAVAAAHEAGPADPGLRRRLAALEARAEHPLARAVGAWAGVDGPLPPVEGFRYRPGRGVAGRVEGHALVAGTAAWLAEHGAVVPLDLAAAAARAAEAGRTPLLVAEDGRARLLLEAEDRLRPEAPEVVRALAAGGLHPVLLSGDRRAAVAAVADTLGITRFEAEMLPEDKAAAVAALRREGRRVAMVGDGVNDAPALAAADVGIAVDRGADLSAESAGLLLTGDDLGRLAEAVALARDTLRVIRQNIGLALAYNAVMVPLAMSGHVTPLLAALAMPASSIAVTLNATRIGRRLREEPWKSSTACSPASS
ncbi:heavy metal translocating P-type ATPase [Inmirania thermothiophila]|uniref:Cu2+-exporting ATPase n=1 Tax=Inmirania thermothiophila TaxID=1750597 RepID=A0A3N1Y6Q4_9GAMM|nr:heavy metal translocating P-type ATPase [Inmirania thermothiophila]ROR34455.1 Cu2+-exporting ATPase [Inmirania thermothiophila]